jgi:hypothetical protein
LLVTFICASVVVFCDIQGWFRADERVNTIGRRVLGYYNFTEYNNIDVFLIGGSHMGAGMEPYTLSCALGSNCFILPGFGGGGLDGMYYFLAQALTETHPKLAVIETYMLDSSDQNNRATVDWVDNWAIQRFEAQRGVLYKLRVMPFLFKSDSWLKAWSNTIRNHSFLLTNFEQVMLNFWHGEQNRVAQRFELGRMVQYETGLTDSTIKQFDSLGATNDGKNYYLSEENREGLRKIMELFAEHNVDVLFLTNPMYYKNVANYNIWRERLGNELKKYPNAKWLDLQQEYDSIVYTPDAFQDCYGGNQHLTRYGMNVSAYKLAEFIKSNNYNLPDRSKDLHWIQQFITQTDFPYNQEVMPNYPGFKIICKNQQINDMKIKEFIVKQGDGSNLLILKIEKNKLLGNTLSPNLIVKIGDNTFEAPLEMQQIPNIFPYDNFVFLANIKQDVEILGITSIKR